jgi:membrane-bound lytic murein transglycosylase B
MKMYRVWAVVALFGIWSQAGLTANDTESHSADHSANYADNAQAQALIEQLVTEEGFDRAQLQALFATSERQDSIIKAMSRPAEKTKTWAEYRKIFVTDTRAVQGVEFYTRFAASLQRAEREFGVPAEVIVAIIGVETRYGRNTGSYRVLDALSTLAFDYPKRSTFFTSELKNYLILTREQGLPAGELKGSYAGAMGYGQFMPSSYRAYAVDFNKDGVTDIWNDPVDAIGSVANYFKRHGWRTGETVVSAATVGETFAAQWMNDGLKPQRTIADFAAQGIVAEQKLDPAASATAMEFEGDGGLEYWLGLRNFYVITRYNHSAMYAMSVYQLSGEIVALQRQ